MKDTLIRQKCGANKEAYDLKSAYTTEAGERKKSLYDK